MATEATSSASEPRSEAASLQRGLAVLELLSERSDGATLSDLSEKLELPAASVLRIARTLVDLGYLSREEGSRRFFLTNRFLRLGQPQGAARSLTECALPSMRSVRQATGETTQLCCLVDVEMVVIEQLLAVHPFKYSADLGARCPCYSCAPGKAIAAFLPEDECERLLDRLRYKRFTPTTIGSKREMRQELARVREAGYALDRAEGMLGIHCVAAPIFDRHGTAVAALTIAAPASRVPETQFESVGRIVQAAAAAATSAFNT